MTGNIETAATRTALKALDTTQITTAYLSQAGRAGIFNFRAGNYSAQITADTEEGLYIKANAVAASAGVWVRSFDGLPMVNWWGALPSNGAAANDTAFNAAISLIQQQTNIQRRALGIPPGHYIVSDLRVENTGLQFTLIGSGRFATALYRPASAPAALIRVKGEGISFTDMSIQQGSFTSADASIGILVKKDYGPVNPPTADSDFSLSRVRITGFATGVEHWGRGLKAEDCDFNACGWGVVHEWPSVGDYMQDDSPVKRDETGFRYFQYDSIRGHSNLFGLFRNDGTNAGKINGINASGIDMDIGRCLWQGVLRQGVISNFTVTQTPVPAFRLADGSENYIIEGGTIQGDPIAERVPTYLIELTGNHDSGVFRDILGRYCESHGIYHDGSGTATDMVIDGLDFSEVCKEVSGANPIRFNGANHTGYIDNVTLDTVSPLTGVIRGTSSSNAMKVGRVAHLRAPTPPLDPSSLGIRMDNDTFSSAPTNGNFATFKDHDNAIRGTIEASGASSIGIWMNRGLDVAIRVGSGNPEGTQMAGRGSLYIDLGAGVNLYMKSTTSGNTGWKLFAREA
ncbi:hypothetical protein [Sinorhizobium sp. RAC02]|uniref:hypothetical protein n=1 Tax=Sinorhizobium sp. RAC02 TaxID=1842534 RepID=UPI000857F140|nr:hypothetical protein [Sinorhizobium sp. RAC02]AOF91867.1 hypothetical protein BSY16_740 [Sinorhizobium sp. RAC02]